MYQYLLRLNFYLNSSLYSPISRIDVNCCQHVIKLHEPDTPWHLHVIRDLLIIAFENKIKKVQIKDFYKEYFSKWIFFFEFFIRTEIKNEFKITYPSSGFVVMNVHFAACLGRCAALIAITSRLSWGSALILFEITIISLIFEIEYFRV